MARAANVDVAVRANTTQFQKGLKKARGQLRSFAKYAAGFAGIQFLRTTAANVDELGKLSDRLNIATEDLIAFRHAGDITGAGATLVSRSLDVMNKRLGEAKNGFGSAVQGLRILNLEAKDFEGLGTAERFKLIAERVKGLSDEQDKAAAVSAIFSRAGLALVNTLNEGADGLQRFKDELRREGGLISREDARAVEEFNDSITRMKTSLLPIGTGILKTFSLAAEGIKMFKDVAVSGIDAVVQRVQGLGAGTLEAAADMVDGMLALIRRFNNLPGVGGGMGPYRLPEIPTGGLERAIEQTRQRARTLRIEASRGSGPAAGGAPDTDDATTKVNELADALEGADTRAQEFGYHFTNLLDGLISRTATLADGLKAVGMSLLRSGIQNLGMQLGNAIFGVNVNSTKTASQGLLDPNVARNLVGTAAGVNTTMFGGTPGAFT